MKKINIKAITVGALTNLFGTLLVLILIYEAVVLSEGLQGEVAAQKWPQISSTLEMLIVFSIVGTLLDFISGIITGLIAKGTEVANASMLGIISFLFGLGLFFTTTSTYPIWFTWAGILITVPATIAGGFVSIKINESGYSFAKYKNAFSGLNFIILLWLFKIISFAVVSLKIGKHLPSASFEIVLGILVAIGLIKRKNYARIILLYWLGLEIILRIPDFWTSTTSDFKWADNILTTVYIVIRISIIYYLQKNSTKSHFIKNEAEIMS